MAIINSLDSKGNAVVTNTGNLIGGFGNTVNQNAIPKPKDPIETLILFFTKSTATLQIGVYKILFGTLISPPLKKVTIDPITGKYIISNNNG